MERSMRLENGTINGSESNRIESDLNFADTCANQEPAWP